MSIKKLIVLCGKQNTGKSQTLLDLIKNLTPVSVIKKPRTKKGRDYIGIWKIKNKNVGIVFAGDTLQIILDGFNAINQSKIKIDVIVCTCHKSHIDYIIKLYGKRSASVVIKEQANNHDNNICKNEILSLI